MASRFCYLLCGDNKAKPGDTKNRLDFFFKLLLLEYLMIFISIVYSCSSANSDNYTSLQGFCP